MTSKLSNLQSALDKTRAEPRAANDTPRPKPAAETAAAAPDVTASRQDNRRGKVNFSAWLDPAFKDSVRLIQARKRGATIQNLLEEALNDVFAKYDVPQVRTDER